MRLLRREVIWIVMLVAALTCGSSFTASASAETAGTVHFVRPADSGFNAFTSSPSVEQQAWLRTHIWRMTVWSPYFDTKNGWYPQGWVYKDAYAIYKGSALASEHPEWILKSATGEDLYIPYACSGGSCTQYAGDITNPAYRHYWIEEARTELARGYRGLFIDDVNMEERVGNGEEQQVTPVSGVTGESLNPAAWRAAMAQFMVEVRAAFPSAEIVHNAIWFADGSAGTSEPSIRREIESANYIYLERGVNDGGLTGGTGAYSLTSLFSFVDEIHALGRGVVFAGGSSETTGMEYNLASYFLLSSGNDAVSAPSQTPSNWWAGWSTNLGEASAPRYSWDSVLRRDYTGGMVLVNPPGSPTRTISLPGPMQTIAGATVTTVTLPAASGVVLTGTAAPVPPKPPTEILPELPTKTIVETTPVSPTGVGGSGSTGSESTGSGSTGSGSSGSGSTGSGSTGSGSTGSGSTGSGSHSHPGGGPARKHSRVHTKAKRKQPTAHRASHRRAHARAAMAKISGRVLSASRGRVAIEIDRLVAGHWVVVKRITASVSSSGRFMKELALHTSSRYRVRAIYTGASGYRPSRSKYRLLELHAS
jgi:Hypothetical glycosyl hydrolase family 15